MPVALTPPFAAAAIQAGVPHSTTPASVARGSCGAAAAARWRRSSSRWLRRWMRKKKYNSLSIIHEQSMSSSQETVHEEHACCSSLSQSFSAKCALSSAPQLDAKEGSHLRTMLNEMTFSQLSVLARSWGVQTDRNLSHERLYEACSEVVDGAINAPDADATHRRIVTERFFGWRSQSQFRNQSRRRGAGIDSSDDGCYRPRARSASPGVDLTVEHFDCPICL